MQIPLMWWPLEEDPRVRVLAQTESGAEAALKREGLRLLALATHFLAVDDPAVEVMMLEGNLLELEDLELVRGTYQAYRVQFIRKWRRALAARVTGRSHYLVSDQITDLAWRSPEIIDDEAGSGDGRDPY